MRLPGTYLLRVGEERIERLNRPGDAAALHRRRVAEVRHLASLAVENAVQARPDAVLARLGRMARGAFLEQLFAMRRIALGMCRADRCQQRHRACQPRSARPEAHHAGTSGPGFLA